MSSRLEKGLIKVLGYQEQEKEEDKRDNYGEEVECEGCGGLPTAYLRLITYKALRKKGFADEWTLDPLFFAYLCKGCFLLWRGHDGAWARHYAKKNKMGYGEAKSMRESEYLNLIEKFGKRIDEMQAALVEYEGRVQGVVIRSQEMFPKIEGMITYIDASTLKVEKSVIVFVIEKKPVM